MVRRSLHSTSCVRSDTHEVFAGLARNGKSRQRIHCIYRVPSVRTQTHHCLSAAARVRQLLRAARTLLPLYEALRLPAPALVHKLRAASELEPLLKSRGPKTTYGLGPYPKSRIKIFGLNGTTICSWCAFRSSAVSTGRESFGHVFLEHGPNGCWSFRVAQNAIDRLGGKTTKLVFVPRYCPGGGANKAESFRLFVQRYVAG